MRRCLLAATMLVGACSERDRSDGSVTASCTPRLPGTGSEQVVPHPTMPTTCRVVVLYENLCVYDGAGQLSHTKSHAVGACAGISTP